MKDGCRFECSDVQHSEHSCYRGSVFGVLSKQSQHSKKMNDGNRLECCDHSEHSRVPKDICPYTPNPGNALLIYRTYMTRGIQVFCIYSYLQKSTHKTPFTCFMMHFKSFLYIIKTSSTSYLQCTHNIILCYKMVFKET